MLEASGIPWAQISGISVPALVSIAAAGIAWHQARQARIAERERERLRRLEERVSGKKYEVYEPIIESFRKMFDGDLDPERPAQVKQFWAWISIYGSDEAVTAFNHFMTTSYSLPLPGALPMRMYVEFVLAARKDMGDPDTTLNAITIMAPIIKDAYDHRNFYEDLSLPLDEVFRKYGWQPPWTRSAYQMIDDRDAVIEAHNAEIADA